MTTNVTCLTQEGPGIWSYVACRASHTSHVVLNYFMNAKLGIVMNYGSICDVSYCLAGFNLPFMGTHALES